MTVVRPDLTRCAGPRQVRGSCSPSGMSGTRRTPTRVRGVARPASRREHLADGIDEGDRQSPGEDQGAVLVEGLTVVHPEPSLR